MRKVLLLGVLVAFVLALVPAVSRADYAVKLSGDYKGVDVTITKDSSRARANKPVSFTCRITATYQKTGVTVYDDKQEADIEPNSAKTFKFNFKDKLMGSGNYTVNATVRNQLTGKEIIRTITVVSP